MHLVLRESIEWVLPVVPNNIYHKQGHFSRINDIQQKLAVDNEIYMKLTLSLVVRLAFSTAQCGFLFSSAISFL